MSSTSQSFVKKKAALTLLRLYRKHPEVIPAAEWALRIISIMDDKDLVRSIPSDQTSEEGKFPVGCSHMRYKSSHGIGARSLGRICGVLYESCRSAAKGIYILNFFLSEL